MGSQINFFHTEEDIILFLCEIEKHGGKIIIEGRAYIPSDAKEKILLHMRSPMCKLQIVCSKQQDLQQRCSDATIATGTAIEFLNCCKGNSLSRTYEAGRLYIAKNAQGIYESQTYLLYKKLCAYIKKRYLYSNETKVYFSTAFKKGLDLHYLYASCLGRPIHF